MGRTGRSIMRGREGGMLYYKHCALNRACVLNFEDDAEELHVEAGSDQVEPVRTIAIAAPHERPSFFSSLLSY